jgi:hypothetical protein
MRSQAMRLPNRFPVGTRYVIEGRGGRIRVSYLEFPDGRQVEVPVRAATPRANSSGGNPRRDRARPANAV